MKKERGNGKKNEKTRFAQKIMMMKDVSIRDGEPTDIPSLYQLILQLAKYEKAENQVVITEEELLKDGFGSLSYVNGSDTSLIESIKTPPLFKFIVAVNEGECIGAALYYQKYSTWAGSCFYLEDLIVSENYRGKGVGKMLMDRLINITKNESKSRLEWQVLNWNKSAIEFYKKYDVAMDSEWINVRLSF